MAKAKILDIRERTKWLGPDKSVQTLVVTYETEKGFRGTIRDIPEDASEDDVWDQIRRRMKTKERLLLTEKELE